VPDVPGDVPAPPGVTRVLAVRHGQTAWNAALRIQGHTDIALDETGQWQARQLARALADEELQAIYSSDLQRAHATAQAVADGAGLAVVHEPGLRERHFGRFEGLTFTEIEAQWPEDARRWRQREPGFAPGGGESIDAFYARSVEACARLAARHRGHHILLVAHGGVLDCLYRAAARLPLDAARTWQLGNASVNRLLHTEAGFSLVGWNDDRHLNEGADPRGV
jgi:2,3-bisphosphoglycerate-dependent phosphoglycerate mutase